MLGEDPLELPEQLQSRPSANDRSPAKNPNHLQRFEFDERLPPMGDRENKHRKIDTLLPP